MILQYLNGDTRSDVVVHWCSGCCGSREEALQNVVAAVQQSGLLGGLSSITPSKSRHGSVTLSLGEQSAGNMIHGLLGRCVLHAFGACRSEEPEQGEGDDQRVWLRNKIRRSCAVLSCRRSRIRAAVLSWLAEPLDHLWMALQYLDTRQCLVQDIQHVEHDPFRRAQRTLTSALITPLCKGGPLGTVWSHYAPDMDQDDCLWFRWCVRVCVCGGLRHSSPLLGRAPFA